MTLQNKKIILIITTLILIVPLYFIFSGAPIKSTPTALGMLSLEQQKSVSVVLSDSEKNLCKSPYSNFILPVGSIIPFINKGGDGIPDGFLLCDGKDITTSGSDYEELRKIIKYRYDPKNARYLLPNFSGRVPKGFQDTGIVSDLMNGKEQVDITSENIPKHRHSLRYAGYNYGSDTHLSFRTYGMGNVNYLYNYSYNDDASSSDTTVHYGPGTDNKPTYSETLLNLDKNTGNPVYTTGTNNNIQRTQVVQYIIKY